MNFTEFFFFKRVDETFICSYLPTLVIYPTSHVITVGLRERERESLINYILSLSHFINNLILHQNKLFKSAIFLLMEGRNHENALFCVLQIDPRTDTVHATSWIVGASPRQRSVIMPQLSGTFLEHVCEIKRLSWMEKGGNVVRRN